jgi:hypothetical protein
MKLTLDRIKEFCLQHGEILAVTPDVIKTITGRGKNKNSFIVDNAKAFHHGKEWYTRDEFEKIVDVEMEKPTK